MHTGENYRNRVSEDLQCNYREEDTFCPSEAEPQHALRTNIVIVETDFAQVALEYSTHFGPFQRLGTHHIKKNPHGHTQKNERHSF